MSAPLVHRLWRRLSALLLVVGGIVLAYPLWSAGYTGLQQGRLTSSYARTTAGFERVVANRAAELAAANSQARRARLLAQLFGESLRPGQPLGRLQIPRIGLNRIVLQGSQSAPSLGGRYNQTYLRSGPTHYGTTPLPGQGRPFAVAGHRTTYGAPFNQLQRLRPGDWVIVTMPYGEFKYRVLKTTVVAPSEVSVLADRGYDLVLTTCHPPYRATQRLVVWGELASFKLAPAR